MQLNVTSYLYIHSLQQFVLTCVCVSVCVGSLIHVSSVSYRHIVQSSRTSTITLLAASRLQLDLYCL